MPKIVASFIHAGGEGKTAVIGNLAAELALRGRRVALLDFDPQGTLTALYGYPFEEIRPDRDTILAYLESGELPEPKRPETFGGRLHLWPAHLAMEELNYDLHADFAKASSLTEMLRALAEGESYDHVLIDLPPSSNAITKLTLLSAHGTVIPATPTPKGAYGVQQAVELISLAQRRRRKGGRAYPQVLLTAINKIERTSLQKKYADAIEALMQERGIPTVRLANRPGLYADASALSIPLPVLVRDPSAVQRTLGRRIKPEAIAAMKEELDTLTETYLKREAEL